MPHSGDQNFSGLARDPDFIAAELPDQEIDGSGTDQFVIFPNPAPIFDIADDVQIN